LSYAPILLTMKGLTSFLRSSSFSAVVTFAGTTERFPRFEQFNLSSLSNAFSNDSGDG